jgi:hypothetical protein
MRLLLVGLTWGADRGAFVCLITASLTHSPLQAIPVLGHKWTPCFHHFSTTHARGLTPTRNTGCVAHNIAINSWIFYLPMAALDRR